MLKLADDFNLRILNGSVDGDWHGEITRAGQTSKSVIDYAMANEEALQTIKSLRIGDRTDSDHFPIELTLEDEDKANDTELGWTQRYTSRNIPMYKVAMARESESLTPFWEDIKTAILNNMPRIPKKVRCTNEWWNEDCYRARCKAKNELRKARRQEVWGEYHAARKNYKKTIEESKRVFNQSYIEKLHKIHNISQAWKYIQSNKYNNKPSASPEDLEFINHFTQLLSGQHSLPDQPLPAITRAESPWVNIKEEEFNLHLNRMKKDKASGPDQIKAEALMYADEKTQDYIRIIMEQCVNGMTIPNDWRGATISPLHKKGPPTIASNYRGIAIGNSIYKLYASIINSRLAEYVEVNNLLPDTQNGFRAKRSTMDNVYVLNYAIQAALAKGRKLFCAFIDFKAAFDMISRSKLFKKLRKMNIPEYLVAAIEDIYAVTPYNICGKTVWTDRGLKQGCPLSPLLFALYISDIDKVMEGNQSGGIVIGRRKIFLLAFADDICLIADRPNELRFMLKVLDRYSDRNDLVVNADKSKVMQFSRGGMISKQVWKYKGTTLEEVKAFKYLGFIFQPSGLFNKHIEDRESAGKRRVSEVWSIGERKFKNNFMIRDQMFRSLVEPTVTYGCEVTGFQEFDSLERIKRRYYRWTLGLGKYTRVAELMDETKTEKMYVTTGRRALAYEERAMKSPCLILKECVRLVQTGEVNRFVEARRRYCEIGGLSASLASSRIAEGITVSSEICDRHRKSEQQLLWCALQGTRYNALRTYQLPKYLQRGQDIKVVARFRLGNEEHGHQKWRKQQQCRICGKGPDTVEHIINNCYKIKGGIKYVLGETGRSDLLNGIIGVRKKQL